MKNSDSEFIHCFLISRVLSMRSGQEQDDWSVYMYKYLSPASGIICHICLWLPPKATSVVNNTAISPQQGICLAKRGPLLRPYLGWNTITIKLTYQTLGEYGQDILINTYCMQYIVSLVGGALSWCQRDLFALCWILLQPRVILFYTYCAALKNMAMVESCH